MAHRGRPGARRSKNALRYTAARHTGFCTTRPKPPGITPSCCFPASLSRLSRLPVLSRVLDLIRGRPGPFMSFYEGVDEDHCSWEVLFLSDAIGEGEEAHRELARLFVTQALVRTFMLFEG